MVVFGLALWTIATRFFAGVTLMVLCRAETSDVEKNAQARISNVTGLGPSFNISVSSKSIFCRQSESAIVCVNPKAEV
jgi:hypothetical protein